MRRVLLVGLVTVLVVGCSGSSPPSATTTSRRPAVDVRASTEVLAAAMRGAAEVLPLRDLIVSSSEDDPNGLLGQPRQYVARVAWRDERVLPALKAGVQAGVETGGSMERFATAPDLTERKQSLDATMGLLINTEVLFVHGLVLVRLPGTLSPAQAAEVDAALLSGLPAPPPSSTTTTLPRAGRPTRTTKPR